MRTCIWSLLLAASLLAFGESRAQPPSQVVATQQEHSFSRSSAQTFKGIYLIYLPDSYDKDIKRRWPVLLYLHGSDARGQDTQRLQKEGLPFFLNTGTRLPFIVVAPLCPQDEWWDSRWMIENTNTLLDEILEKYRTNKGQVYLTGWSMGGGGVWSLASAHADRFAAIVPVSGRTQLKYTSTLRKTPIWAFHGGVDRIVPVSESQKMVDALKSDGSARLTVFKDDGHDVWNQVYGNSELYEWLLSHSKTAPLK